MLRRQFQNQPECTCHASSAQLPNLKLEPDFFNTNCHAGKLPYKSVAFFLYISTIAGPMSSFGNLKMSLNALAYHNRSAQIANLKLEPDILVPAPCAQLILMSAYLQCHTFTGVQVYAFPLEFGSLSKSGFCLAINLYQALGSM